MGEWNGVSGWSGVEWNGGYGVVGLWGFGDLGIWGLGVDGYGREGGREDRWGVSVLIDKSWLDYSGADGWM